MEFLPLSRRRFSSRNVPSGEEPGETDVFAGYKFINFSFFVLTAHMNLTHLVLSLLAVVPARLKYPSDYQCSMRSKIHHYS